MSEPFIAEIRIWGLNFAPRGWAFCDGQLLPIAQNTALFSLVGTYYGGDGRTTFGLPNLQGRAPMHPGNGPGLSTRRLWEHGGVNTVTLTEAQMPNHNHLGVNPTTPVDSEPADLSGPAGNFLAVTTGSRNRIYREPLTAVPTGATAGGGQAHTNMQPYLALNFCIALTGLYPSRN